MPPPKGPSGYRVGPFLVDRTGYRALRGNQPLDLTPKLLDLLLHFLDHAGELVTKEALLEALWPDANVTAQRSNPGSSDCTLQLSPTAWSALKSLFR